VQAFEIKMYIPVVFKLLVWCEAEGYVSSLQDAANWTHNPGSVLYGVGD